MRILCEYSQGGSSFVRTGWGRVFKALGHSFTFWNPEEKPAFDAFDETRPDAFLGTTYGIDKAVFRCIAARPKMKVGLFASAWGEWVANIDSKKYPIVIATNQEKLIIETLKSTTGKPDFVFIHAGERFLEGILGGWREIGVRPISVLNAADAYIYLGGEHKEEYACDVAFIGGRWPFKARNLDRFLLPLCHPSKGLNVKIFGSTQWPVSNYLGVLDEPEARHVFKSAKVCPNISEPHSTDLGLGDVIERIFKVPASGGMLVSDAVEGIDDIFGKGVVPQADNPRDFESLIRHYIAHPDEREKVIGETRRIVLSDHCYHQRVATFFEEWDLPGEAARCRELHKKLVSEVVPEVLR